MNVWNNLLGIQMKEINHVRFRTFEAKIYSPIKVKHHLTCFNNIFSNNELISNRFAVIVTSIHTYLLTCETGY